MRNLQLPLFLQRLQLHKPLLPSFFDVSVVFYDLLSFRAHDVVDEILCCFAYFCACYDIERTGYFVCIICNVFYRSFCSVDLYCLNSVV